MTRASAPASLIRPLYAVRWGVVAAALAGAASPVHAAFVDVTPDTLTVGTSLVSVWLDVDGDQDLDLFLTGIATNRLMRNDGGGTLTEVTPASWVVTPNGSGATAADYDNDGDVDVFAASNTVANRLYRNGAGGLIDVAVPPVSTATSAAGSSWLDYDKDGDVDLLVSNHNGANRLYRNDAGVFVSVALPATGTLTESFVCGDYDNDGDPDVFVCSPNGTAGYLLRNDAGTFVNAATPPLTTILLKSGCWGDFDNDGDLDLFGVRSNRMYFLRNDGGGTFVDITAAQFPFVGGVSGTLVDYDNDGDLDASVTQFNRLLLIRNNNPGFASDVVLGVSGTDMSWGDYDGDGDLDVFATGPGQLFRNDLPAGNHWLHLDLVGTVSNRSAIGARVVLVAGGVRQIREVAGVTSFGSQNSLTVEFGLGAATVIDSLVVRWPSGIVQTVNGLTVDARHTIIEGGVVSVGDSEVAIRGPRLSPAVPNPASGAVRFTIDGARGGSARLTIHDVRGRLVATPWNAGVGGGHQSVIWNARRGDEALVPAGVYFARLRWTDDAGRTTERRQRFVLIR